jgi:hypothetical protein
VVKLSVFEQRCQHAAIVKKSGMIFHKGKAYLDVVATLPLHQYTETGTGALNACGKNLNNKQL